jgi:hypothetical protein
LSLLLFNLVANMLSILINKAKEDGQVRGLVSHLIDGGVSILQYVDDTVLFMENDLEQAKNMKLLLCAFEQLSGLKINFHKSEVFCYGEAKETEDHYTNLFGCGLGQYPVRYLGIPMHHKKISNADWKVIEEKIEKKTKLLERKAYVIWQKIGLDKLCFKQLSYVYVIEGPEKATKGGVNESQSKFLVGTWPTSQIEPDALSSNTTRMT